MTNPQIFETARMTSSRQGKFTLHAAKSYTQVYYWSAIPQPDTMVLAIHLNKEQVKVCYSDVSANWMFATQIPTVP